MKFEKDYHTPRQRVSEIYITNVSTNLPVLPYLLPVFYPGSGEVRSVKG